MPLNYADGVTPGIMGGLPSFLENPPPFLKAPISMVETLQSIHRFRAIFIATNLSVLKIMGIVSILFA